ncbi:excalibur calcium-binding domain-containing protein [Corynebacterium cystitidis]|uniref:Excalibur calcium-binding domain-containing protein n=1 Tax=Corynebacterium cystitidis DSM 20524 TaxID=1121357 RepID=A0A1H9VM97_9CORY|nr:excalibur calcium-binding domain-containing protein [Corynebacterium cystitidis]WJY82896.1 Excalibur calcium-binding domain protein [Corynebacterium cystitidis DSM 20524]SES22920.1 Excalibur calcium-binding domain-containing protein [Corynebacterium cystitidis DSM 20524]SNV69317.1 Metallo-beta-lactamase superfamily hydrolase [Corynebacterium cystitidis]
MSHRLHPQFRRFTTLAALTTVAISATACAGSPDDTAEASLNRSTTVTEVTTAFSTITVTETVTAEPAPAPEPEPAPEPAPAPEENNQQLGFLAPPPAPAPAPPPAPAPAPAPPAAPAAASVYYANCSEARAAGAAPIYAGEPGYRSKLDRDGDGVACE